MIEAWVDVGGTFTDCYVHYSGNANVNEQPLRRLKILSSGRVPISVELANRSDRVSARELKSDGPEFWTGSHLLQLSPDGVELQRIAVTAFANGVLSLERSIDGSQHDSQQLELRYELVTDLTAPVLGIRRLLACPILTPLPRLHVRMGTTKGTNALLTRTGAKTAFAITAPFEDLLEIGDQTRPYLFALDIRKPPTLAHTTLSIHERMDAKGRSLEELDLENANSVLARAREAGCTSLAICLMHSYVNPSHETQLKTIAEGYGFDHISCSSSIAPLIEIVARAQTTLVDAYLSPIVHGYLREIVSQLGGSERVQLLVMTSAGGLVDWKDYSGKDSILSGPAGGIAALRAISSASGRETLIGLDMGGTSTDVSRVSVEQNLQYESTKADVRILTPTLPIETVASGGGSICWFDGVSLRVGPQSAGALPGPACYGRGGPLTVTDLNVFMDRVPGPQFPFALNREAIFERLTQLQQEIEPVLGSTALENLAQGLRRIASEQMAEAVRTVSIAQGADPRQHTLVGFGGAAGQHICEIAETLGITSVLDSAEGGLLSALGMGLADRRLDEVIPVYELMADVDWIILRRKAVELAAELKVRILGPISNELRGADSEPATQQFLRLELRYEGSDVSLTLPWDEKDDCKNAFDKLHHSRYGYAQTARKVELVAVRIEQVVCSPHALPGATSATAYSGSTPKSLEDSSVVDENQAFKESADQTAPVVYRDNLKAGQQLTGPVVVANGGSTLYVDKGWTAQALPEGLLELRFHEASGHATRHATSLIAKEFDPVFRECFAQRLSAIATQMGLVLQQTAISVNVKQRRDYSCAVFDQAGQLLANAPHVPVHLGAMGASVRATIKAFPDIVRGDCFVTNDPFQGGSHLPDITVITPVFASTSDKEPMFFVASRAHHADVGGISPGSMSIEATKLSEEGVVIPITKLVDGGVDRSQELASFLEAARWPPRNLAENMADLSAQQAANQRGVQLLRDYAEATSWSQLCRYSEFLLQAAEQRVRNFVKQKFPSGGRSQSLSFKDALDDGTAIAVAITATDEASLQIDFAGTGAESPSNFNANPSIVTAAILYVIRCLVADDLPLNEGVLRCIDLRIPEGLLNPCPNSRGGDSPAVAAGNVETSQRIVDVLVGAFGAAAASQGTMNNLLFGNQSFGFYETICGGAGATASSHGADGVHTHMTNTRLTDPEILEARYPVRLLDFGMRHGSGGIGEFRGGDGVRRTLEFLEDVEVSLLTSRRGQYPPFGLCGGSAGTLGRNVLIKHRPTDQPNEVSEEQRWIEIELPSCCQFKVAAGQRLRIETPGGGGFGEG